MATERVRRVTWRMGIIGSALTMFLLFCMGVTCSSFFSVGLVSWVTITGCLNFRAYHVEDIGMQNLKKKLVDGSGECRTHDFRINSPML